MPLYLDNTFLHVYVKCTHRHDSPAADEQPNNKRQQENAEPRPRLRLENQTGPLSGEHVLLVFHLSVTSFPRRVPFFFTQWIHRQDNSIYNYAIFNHLTRLGFFCITILYRKACCFV